MSAAESQFVGSNVCGKATVARPGFVLSRAFGEFAVIVLGVLVALAADAWNDRRLDRLEEREYLSRLHGDLARDTAQYAFVLAWMERKEEALDSVATWLAEVGSSPDSLVMAHHLGAASNFGWNVGPLGTSATFEDLRSSGKLGLITNADLRAGLIRYREDAESEDRRIDARRTEYPSVAYRFLRSAADPEPDPFGASETVEFESATALLGQLRASELGSHVRAERNRTLFVRQVMLGLREQAAGLIDLVGEELSRSR